MATGDYWDESNPERPFGLLDKQEIKHIPYDFSDWRTSEGATYVSHTLDYGPEMTASTVAVVGGVIKVSVNATEQAMIGGKYGVTVLLTDSDGQKKSKTLYYKIKEL